MSKEQELIAEAIKVALISPNVPDANLEPANVVDVLASLAVGVDKLGKAITTPGVPWRDEDGGQVGDLTEAGISISIALRKIAAAIENVGVAIDRVARALEKEDSN